MLKKILHISFFLTCFIANSQTKDNTEELPAISDVFKPKVSLGLGMLSFHGDLYSKHYQAPWTARIGYDLSISQRLSKSLQLNFNVLFGKLGANEWLANRQENFQSEIRSGGISVLYDFGDFIPDKFRIRPWISAGINSFEFLSKTDRLDKNGRPYYYWNDGTIRTIDQNAPNAFSAIETKRDYIYESDIRELNKDGFGKYQERSWALPIGAGALMKVTDRIDLKLGFQYYFTTTDYVDGITNKSTGSRLGNTKKDNFVYTSFALQYDLIITKKTKLDTLPDGYFKDIDWLAIENGDYDKDGIKDWDDKCHGTPEGAKVNEFGCQFDEDKDGVPNESDDEQQSPDGSEVNLKGVALTDDYWQAWYDTYMDSLGNPKIEIVGNAFAIKNATNTTQPNILNKKEDKIYTIELVRYVGPVPSEEMSKLLSIGDIQSTLLPDNNTVVYSAGTYKEVANAVVRRDEFIAEGLKEAKVGYFKDGNLIALKDDELKQLIQEGIVKTTNTATTKDDSTLVNTIKQPKTDIETDTDSTQVHSNSLRKHDTESNHFKKGDVVFRVQLGAYSRKISKSVFKQVGKVIELKTDLGLFVYATNGYKTIQDAAEQRANLVVEGYTDAFITAYKDGKRIPLSATKATMESNEKEDMGAIKVFSSIDKSLVSFKIQLGALRKTTNAQLDERMATLGEVEKQTTGSGMTRYTVGSFTSYKNADNQMKEIADKGFTEAFIIAMFKGEVISIQEAEELSK